MVEKLISSNLKKESAKLITCKAHAKMLKSEMYKRIPMVYPVELQIDRSIKRIFLHYTCTIVE